MKLSAADPNSAGLPRRRERTVMAGVLCTIAHYRHCHSENILDALRAVFHIIHPHTFL